MNLEVPQPSPLAPGYKLDRYELLCPIAEGGMASVWIARQTGKHGFQKLVAIKTILPKYASDPGFQQMFLDEVRIASRIEHVNVTQILDVGEQHGVTYLVMEYVDGDALSKVHRVAREKSELIPPGIVLRVMADACGGLHAAHELHDVDGKPLGVVHRDISPQNILVSTKGIAKLIDFGIATARNRVTDDTGSGQLKGKVRYMAPEHALGHEMDRRADIWAVGAVLYHLLSGRAPFEGENEANTLFLLTSGRPPTPMSGTFHPAVSAVVRRALSHAVDLRYPTAAEMQEAIEDAIKQADLATSTAAVAHYLATEVGARAEKRKEAIALGLNAAEARERYADIMRTHTEKSSGGSASGARVMAEVLSARADRRVNEDVTAPEMPSSASRSGSGTGTGQTLGSAAISIGAGAPRRGMRVAVVGGVVAVAVALLAVGFLRGPRGSASAASGAARTAGLTATTPKALPDIPPPPAPELDTMSPPTPPPTASSTIAPPATGVAQPALKPASPAPPRAVTTPPQTTARPAAPRSTGVPRVNDGF